MLLVLGACLAGCGASAPGPTQAVQNYVNSLSEADYATACTSLDGPARSALERSAGAKLGCPRVLKRCLPNKAIVLNKDQTQLFYANVAMTTHGNQASALVSGTLVASAVRAVSLRRERGQWLLTSPGVAVQRCAPRLARFSAKRHG